MFWSLLKKVMRLKCTVVMKSASCLSLVTLLLFLFLPLPLSSSFPLFTVNPTCTLFIIGWSLTASSHLLFYSAHSSRPLSFHSLVDFLPLNTLHFLIFSFSLQVQSRSKVTATKAIKVCALCSQWLTHEQTPTQNRRGWEWRVGSVVMGDAAVSV